MPAFRRRSVNQSANQIRAVATLLQLVPPPRILLGTDFPFRTGPENVTGLATCGLSADDLRAIERDNALRLLPGLVRAA